MVFLGILGVISSYFWFMFGNRCYISAMNIEPAYVGFPKFNFYITGMLLIISQVLKTFTLHS